MNYTYAITGATGHVGSALAQQLLRKNQSLLMIAHGNDEEEKWNNLGAAFEVADISDSDKLHQLFAKAERLFILNPPADPAKDAEKEELKQIDSIVNALKGLTPLKIVVASTYGARNEESVFDLGTCYQLEEAIKTFKIPYAIIRSAYYMSNWDLPVQMAMKDGKLSTLFPADFKLPMVSPGDIGQFASELLSDDRTGTFYIQASEEYAANDVAVALTEILNTAIKPHVIAEKDWSDYMQKGGFSAASTRSFIGMTRLTLNEKFIAPQPNIGETTLEQYLVQIVKE